MINSIAILIRGLILVALYSYVDCVLISQEARTALNFHHCIEIENFTPVRTLKNIQPADRIDNICFSIHGNTFHFVTSDDDGQTTAMVLRNEQIRFTLMNENLNIIDLFLPLVDSDDDDEEQETGRPCPATWDFSSDDERLKFYKDMYVDYPLEDWNYNIIAMRTVDISENDDDSTVKYDFLAAPLKFYSEMLVREHHNEEQLFTFRQVDMYTLEEKPIIIVKQKAFGIARPKRNGYKVALLIYGYSRYYIVEFENNEKANNFFDEMREYTLHSEDPSFNLTIPDEVWSYM